MCGCPGPAPGTGCDPRPHHPNAERVKTPGCQSLSLREQQGSAEARARQRGRHPGWVMAHALCPSARPCPARRACVSGTRAPGGAWRIRQIFLLTCQEEKSACLPQSLRSLVRPNTCCGVEGTTGHPPTAPAFSEVHARYPMCRGAAGACCICQAILPPSAAGLEKRLEVVPTPCRMPRMICWPVRCGLRH